MALKVFKNQIPDFVIDNSEDPALWSWSEVPYSKNCSYCINNTTSDLIKAVDLVAVIHLKNKPKRLQEVTEELHNNGLCRKSLILNADNIVKKEKGIHAFKNSPFLAHKCCLDPGSCGCYISHSLMSHFFRDKKVLVLEDDVQFTKKMKTHQEKFVDSIQQIQQMDPKVDQVMLGSFSMLTWPSAFQDCKSLWRTKGMMTHAYVMFPKGHKRLLESDLHNEKKRIPIDIMFKNKYVQYSFYPTLAVQRLENVNTSEIAQYRPTLIRNATNYGLTLQAKNPFFATFGFSLVWLSLIILFSIFMITIVPSQVEYSKKRNTKS